MDDDRQRTTRRRAAFGVVRARVAALAAAGVLAGCGADATIAPTPFDRTPPTAAGGATGQGGGAVSASLTGSWRRVLYFSDGNAIRASVTTWSFDGRGGATRVVTAQNLTAGVADAVVSSGTYTATASTVTVRFVTPDAGTVRYGWRVETSATNPVPTLFLDGDGYTQVTQATQVGF